MESFTKQRVKRFHIPPQKELKGLDKVKLKSKKVGY